MKKNIHNINDTKQNKDMIIGIVLTLTISIILMNMDAFELFSEYSKQHEDYELDEIVLIVLVASFVAIWYSIRRFYEVKKLKNLIHEMNKDLTKDNIKKDELLLHKTKMASLGEMIENIAHQWRQPLSVISTCASGIKLQKEFYTLDDKELIFVLDNIMTNANYLSNTIDDFRNFAKNNKNKVTFNVNENINKNIDILKGCLQTDNIIPILDFHTDAVIGSYPNELTQIFINLINNSKDAMIDNNIKNKYIFITTKKENDKLIIEIRDNGNGIPEHIIKNIFEPYFTTKHKSQGTGLGLYMSYKIVTESMLGEILVKNVNYTYKEENYRGAQFDIVLPLDIMS